MATGLISIHGLRLMIGGLGQLISNSIEITHPAVTCTATVGVESANVRAITIQFKDSFGANIASAVHFRLMAMSSAAHVDLAAVGGSTGIAIGANGKILNTVVAKKIFDCASDATGLWTGTYTDVGTDVAFLAVRLPNGVLVPGSTALTNT